MIGNSHKGCQHAVNNAKLLYQVNMGLNKIILIPVMMNKYKASKIPPLFVNNLPYSF